MGKFEKDVVKIYIKSSGYKNPVPMSMIRLIKHPYVPVDNTNLEINEKYR